MTDYLSADPGAVEIPDHFQVLAEQCPYPLWECFYLANHHACVHFTHLLEPDLRDLRHLVVDHQEAFEMNVWNSQRSFLLIITVLKCDHHLHLTAYTSFGFSRTFSGLGSSL